MSTLKVNTIEEQTSANGVTIDTSSGGGIKIKDEEISSLSGDLKIKPLAGQDLVLDDHLEIDGNLIGGLTDNNTVITAYSGKNITIESVTFDGGVVAGITTLDTTGNISCDGDIIMGDGKGIDFSAYTDGSIAGTTTSQILNDYEEGTFTPILEGSTGGTATYGSNTYGFYTLVGQLLTINFILTLTSIGTLTGDIRLGGLPYALKSSGQENRYPVGATQFGNLSANWSSLTIASYGGTTAVRFSGIKVAAATTIALNVSELTNTTYFNGSLQYII